MIERYSRPEMAAIFSDQARMDGWLRVEQAALRALVAEGIAPAAAADALDLVTHVDVAKVQAREAEIHHDLAAFVDVTAAAVPEAEGWLHYGLTSSDVVDTALALQLGRAATLVLGLSAFVATVILTDRMEQAVIHARHFAHKTSRIWALATGPIEEVH